MSEKFSDEKALMAAVRDLPVEIPPGRDLWPEIAARLPDRAERSSAVAVTGSWRSPALAASVAVAFLAGILFGQQLGRDAEPARLSQPDFGMLAALEASEREYQAAFREFIPVGVSRSMLEAEAVQHIENSWFALQQAEAALLTALRDFPENTYLNEKLLDLRAQQLGFMKQLAMLDQTSRRKI